MVSITTILIDGQNVNMPNLRSYLLERETQFRVDANFNLAAVGDNVFTTHVFGGVRTQGGATLDGSSATALGGDNFTRTSDDATTSVALGHRALEAPDKCYGSEALGFRSMSAPNANVSYVSALAIDVFKDVTFGRNSVGAGAKAGLYCTNVQDATVLGVSAGAGGGSLQSVVLVGGSAVDNNGSATGRANVQNLVAVGEYSCRGASGTLFSVFVGNGSAQLGALTGTFNAGLGHSVFSQLGSGSLNAAGGYSASSNLTNQNNTTAFGALAQPAFSGSAAFGYNATTTGTNQVQLGGSGTTAYAYGAVQDRSDFRDKTDIRDCDLGLDFLREVRWRSFRWNMREDYMEVALTPKTEVVEIEDTVLEKTGERNSAGQDIYAERRVTVTKAVDTMDVSRTFMKEDHQNAIKAGKRHHLGVIAQELKEVSDRLGVDFAGLQHHAFHNDDPSNDFEGEDVWSVGYQEFIPVLGKAVQEIDARLSSFEARLAVLEEK